jgi:hypothetical protein
VQDCCPCLVVSRRLDGWQSPSFAWGSMVHRIHPPLLFCWQFFLIVLPNPTAFVFILQSLHLDSMSVLVK